MICPNCGNDQEKRGACCRREIGRLRSRLNAQSRHIERVEDERDKYERRAQTPTTETLQDPWETH